jgi:hypothetical protein
MMLTGMEAAMADSTVTRQVLQVEHAKIDSPKTFAEVEAALEGEDCFGAGRLVEQSPPIGLPLGLGSLGARE